ncbi:MarR family winged helix-turn-helix transcriptional regulator [Streptomyces beijiangensis]|uniref:MarR family transcriptional regulator n=1 Tax=Streptomyces beijiangensis TaxID=163361 RepID=A0A939F6P8_9ACTN|nr:MarR family transcriptional regulator [Streptomyces beijiangensis]MBO0511410.1 MarR family transcriptional regulator [Streptomyces beijiangensis]
MPPEDRLGLDIKRAEQELIAAKSAAVKPAGLTVPQYAALLGLSGSPGISAAALARACLVTPQAMNVVLKNLQERGLVERTPHPWHGNVLETRLTREGSEAFTAADERAVAIERRIEGEFSAAERELLRSLLARAVSAIRDDGGA